MKIKYLLVLVLIYINSSLTKETNELIKKVISNILSSVPNLKTEISQSISSKSTEVAKIVNGGFNAFAQKADIQYFEEVNNTNLDQFFKYLANLVKLPNQYEQSFIDTLSIIEFSEYTQVVTYRLIYSIDQGGDCRYVCIMGQRNEENNATDWLLANIDAEFMLAPDVFAVTTSKSYVWGLYSTYDSKIISQPKSLDQDSLNTLVKFFEVLVFERFAEVLRISGGYALKFLQ